MPRWLADTQAIAVITGCKPATIRSWAHRGLLARRGTGRHGRALYDVEEAEQLAASPDALEKPAAMCNTEASAGACPQAGKTIRAACEDSSRAGLPVESRHLSAIIRQLPGFVRIGEVRRPAGSQGGRGDALYEAGELEDLITALAPWLAAPPDAVSNPPGVSARL